MIQIGKTYYVNLYDNPQVELETGITLHETFEQAVSAARHELSLRPEVKLLHILECSPIKGLEPLEMYP